MNETAAFLKNMKNTTTMQRAILAIILLIAAILRYKSAWFSYPLITHPDEPTMIGLALKMQDGTDFNPHFFNYPSLIIYLWALAIFLASSANHLLFGSGATEISLVNLHVMCRLIASAMATLSVYAVYLSGKKLFDGWAGIFSAGILAISPLAVDNSALAMTDIWVATISAFILLACTHILKSSEKALLPYLLAGFLTGLAIGAKYTAFIFFISVVVAHILKANKNQLLSLIDVRLFLSGMTAIVTFIFTTPFAVLDSKKFLADVLFEGHHYRTGHPGFEAQGNTSWHLYGDAILSSGMGWVFGILSIAGIFLALKREYRVLLMVYAMPLGLFIFVGGYKVFFPRNIVGAIPCLAVAAGGVLFFFSQKLIEKTSQPLRKFFPCIYAIVFALGSPALLAKTLSDIAYKNLPDTRWISLLWVNDHLPAGASVAVEAYSPPIGSKHKVTGLGILGLVSNKEKITSSKAEFVIFSSYSYGRLFDMQNLPQKNYERQAKIYSDFFENHELIYELSPKENSLSGPKIMIYKTN